MHSTLKHNSRAFSIRRSSASVQGSRRKGLRRTLGSEQLEMRLLLTSGNDIWSLLDEVPAGREGSVAYTQPERYQALTINQDLLVDELADVTMEFSAIGNETPFTFSIPAPDGSFDNFEIVETMVLEPELAAKFPEIKTYLGQGVTDAAATLRFDVTPLGFHAQVLSPNGAYYVDPYYHLDQSAYISYYRSDLGPAPEFEEFHLDDADLDMHEGTESDGPEAVVSRRDIRTTITTTTTYNSFFGNTVTNVLAAVTTAINRITGVYEVDSAIRLILVNDTTRLFSGLSGAGTDNPNGTIAGGSNVSTLSTNNQSFTDSRIGSANYDLGHVFHRGSFNGISGGGIGIVGRSGLKARAATSGTPNSDVFYIDYVSHEMGHQFGGRHNFNNCSGSQGDNSVFANEPGSGSTIMGYAGICGSTNIQNNSNAYFNYINLNQIRSYINSGTPQGLAPPVATTNNTPIIDPLTNFTIPDQTPFRLIATGSDPDGDTVSYTWEQSNTGGGPITLGTDPGFGPIIRSRTGVTSGERMIPPLTNVLAGTLPLGETLPLTNRNLNFVVTARDNRASEGGTTQASMVVTSVNGGNGFMITSPNTTGITYPGGSSQTVTWDVSGSNVAPVNTANVRILLSTDGGTTFPHVLASSTANDGTEDVQIPATATTQARIMIEAEGNIFFDINNRNFTITGDSVAPTATATAPDITTAGGSTQTISVTYSDNVAIDASDIGDGDIEVIAPDTSTLVATFISATSTSDTTPITATYEITAPGGTWDMVDNGTYSIMMLANEVGDTSNQFVPAGLLETFDVNISATAAGDFNGDGNLDCADVDALTIAIASGSTDLLYDVTGDSLVNGDDLTEWILNLKGTLFGDANLDFIVDGTDFLVWNANKFTLGTTWCNGDFDADGVTDGSDFLIWNANKFQSADSRRSGPVSNLDVQADRLTKLRDVKSPVGMAASKPNLDSAAASSLRRTGSQLLNTKTYSAQQRFTASRTRNASSNSSVDHRVRETVFMELFAE